MGRPEQAHQRSPTSTNQRPKISSTETASSPYRPSTNIRPKRRNLCSNRVSVSQKQNFTPIALAPIPPPAKGRSTPLGLQRLVHPPPLKYPHPPAQWPARGPRQHRLVWGSPRGPRQHRMVAPAPPPTPRAMCYPDPRGPRPLHHAPSIDITHSFNNHTKYTHIPPYIITHALLPDPSPGRTSPG
jgi:hypothetical protein